MFNLTYDEILSRIEYFRNNKNYSAYKLGRELGHSNSYFYRIETKSIKISLETFLDILEILDVSTSEFFYDDYKNYQRDKDFLKIAEGLSEEQIKSLNIILKRN